MAAHMTEPTFDLLVQGFPGSSPSNGGMGWSSVGLVRTGGHVVLLDTGPFGVRDLLRRRLADHGLEPADITDVVLTHAHHDHAINWPMFVNARVHLSAVELGWSVKVSPGTSPVAEFSMRELARRDVARPLVDDGEIAPGLRTVLLPGHTPGSLMVVVDVPGARTYFVGDAVKNRAELLSGTAEASLDSVASHLAITLVRARWLAEDGSVVVPGHDLPLAWRGGESVQLGEREASVEARFGTDLAERALIRLQDSAS
ncbi:putative Metallo-beta-lactamase [metagenome]|uniref:Putative Metallo-beta-lactamase n=1 Tax=metagenome TaxID=256318 RepID=A0A2P2C8Y1_9ZZZZ